MQIFRVMHAVPYSNQVPVCDIIANLHAYITCNMLIALAILLSWKQFGGRPIECMLPVTGATFSGAWEQYAESICWSEDTYYIAMNDTVETYTETQRREKRISYYQWIPFFLLFQAACFKAPTLIWRYFAGQAGMRVGEVLRLATNESNAEPSTRASNIQSLCTHLQGALRFRQRLKKVSATVEELNFVSPLHGGSPSTQSSRNLSHHKALFQKQVMPHKIIRCFNVKYSSYYVSLIYMLTKAVFLANVLMQTDMLNRYFIPRASTQNFGYSAWKTLWYGNETWQSSGLFPRVSLCDFQVREMGQPQTFTVQCVLLINALMEKAFIVLWAYYNVLTFVTLFNFTHWSFSLINPRSSDHFIINHLEMHGSGVFANESTKGLSDVQVQVGRFIDKYLRLDGVFILRLIAQHADVVFTTDLIAQLWCSHYRIERQREALKLSDQRWQEHLRRFNALEERAFENKMGDGLTHAFIGVGTPSDESTPLKRRYARHAATLSPPMLQRHHSASRVFETGLRSLDQSSDEDDEEHREKSRVREAFSSRNSSISTLKKNKS